jgi:two-component system chemotaxis sensor kinase CheA
LSIESDSDAEDEANALAALDAAFGVMPEEGADQVAAPFEAPVPASEPVAEAADPAPAPAAAKTAAPKAETAKTGPNPTLRVDLERVDRLINAVGELIINHSMLAQQIANLDVADLRDVETELEGFKNLARDIQEGVMSIRAQPVKPLFQRRRGSCAKPLPRPERPVNWSPRAKTPKSTRRSSNVCPIH